VTQHHAPDRSGLDQPGGLSPLAALVLDQQGGSDALATLSIHPPLFGDDARPVTRGTLAMALNVCLFADLLARVPTAARHVAELHAAGERVVFDHGALRTIAGPTGALPSGHRAFARLLKPLGYMIGGLYPLPRLTMTGRAFVHRDWPDTIPQFFVSELHVDQLPEPAQAAAARVFGASRDPVGPEAKALLDKLAQDGALPMEQATMLLPTLLAAFGRHHPEPSMNDYVALLDISKEAAWIATEGNAFNHATTRVPDVEALAERLKAQGYPMKDAVEVSANGRVRQTAILADKVVRRFSTSEGAVAREVPGSFYEFISRDIDPASGTLDLTFDSRNATGIFAVTRSA
jgi:hypothetical protein